MTNDNFFVALPSYNVDNTGFYKQAVINRIRTNYPWLTVAGLSNPTVTPKGNHINGVQNAGPGNLLTFGTGKFHDVNWVRRPEYATERGYEPIIDPVKNWNTLVDKLHNFAMNRKPVYNSYRSSSNTYALGNDRFVIGGNNVTITDDFVYVGAKALPRTLTSRTYSTLSVPVRRQLEAIAIVIERI